MTTVARSGIRCQWDSVSDHLLRNLSSFGGSLAARLVYVLPPPTRLKIPPQQLHHRRAGQADPKEPVHRTLLNLRPSLPTRNRRLADAQQVGEVLLDRISRGSGVDP
jgi:hypothetical protein